MDTVCPYFEQKKKVKPFAAVDSLDHFLYEYYLDIQILKFCASQKF